MFFPTPHKQVIKCTEIFLAKLFLNVQLCVESLEQAHFHCWTVKKQLIKPAKIQESVKVTRLAIWEKNLTENTGNFTVCGDFVTTFL